VADWATISSFATAGGTLVLAIATFAAVKSANRAARTTERSLMEGLRPLLVPSRMGDPPAKIPPDPMTIEVLDGDHESGPAHDQQVWAYAAR
jgi:plasmid stabilization system protein ParE